MLKFIKTKKLITTLGLAVCTSIGFAQSTIDWAKQIGGTQQDYLTDIRYRLVGTTDVFVAVGRFSGSITLSPTITLTTPSTTDTAMFVARFNMAGVCQWAVTAGNANVSTWANAVDIAADGSILVGGVIRGAATNTVDFNPGTAVTNLTCEGGQDIFVAKYTAAGALSWAFDLGGTQDEAISDIAFDQAAVSTDTDFYITGVFESLLKFDPAGGNNYRLTNAGVLDVFLGKYKLADGAVTWVNTFGVAGGRQSSPKIKVRNNHLVLNFQPSGIVDMDPGTGVNTNDGLGYYNKSTGALVWAAGDVFSQFELASNGDVFKIGGLNSIKKYSSTNGSLLLNKVVVAPTPNKATPEYRLTSLTVDNTDNVVVSGWYESDYFNLNQASVTLDGIKTLPITTYNQPNQRILFTAIFDDVANYLQGGAIGGEFISTNPNQPDARLDYLTVTNMQMKGNTELFVAGTSTVDLRFGWSNSSTSVTTTNAASTGTRDGLIINFNITPTCVTPTLTTTNAERCGPGTVTLTASPSAGTVNWYATATSTAILGTGTSFTTPSISAVTTFFAEAVNGTCVSARVGALATVRGIPTITGVTGAARCGAGTVTLSASNSGGATSMGWYTTSSGGSALGLNLTFTTPSISTTTTYYVEAVNGVCASSRTAVVATINPVPTISGTPSGRCGTGTVILGATPSAGTVSWFAASSGGSSLASGTSFTTPSISATTTFYAEATANSCVSARTPIVATVSSPPSLTTTGAARCGSGSVTLSATPSAGTVSWFAAASGGSAIGTGTNFATPNITATTTYYALATNGGCSATSRVAAIATVNALPNVAVTTSGAVLTATETGATYQWVTCGNKNSYNPILTGINNAQSYTGGNGGVYAVFVTKNGCKDTSSCITLTVTGVEEETTMHNVAKIFPNPNNGEFSIELTLDAEVEIVDQMGRIVKTIQVEKGRPYAVDDLPEGLFILKSKASNKAILGKVLVSK